MVKRVHETPVIENLSPPVVRVVKCNRLNIRSAPRLEPNIISDVPSGTILNFLDSVNSIWAHVQTLDGANTGYAMHDFLESVQQ